MEVHVLMLIFQLNHCLLVIKLVDVSLVSISVGEFVEICRATFKSASERTTPDMNVHLMTLQLGFVCITLSTDVTNERLFMIFHVLVDFVNAKFLFSAESGFAANFACLRYKMLHIVVMVERVGTGEGYLALLALARLVVVVDVLLHLQRALQHLAAWRTRP